MVAGFSLGSGSDSASASVELEPHAALEDLLDVGGLDEAPGVEDDPVEDVLLGRGAHLSDLAYLFAIAGVALRALIELEIGAGCAEVLHGAEAR